MSEQETISFLKGCVENLSTYKNSMDKSALVTVVTNNIKHRLTQMSESASKDRFFIIFCMFGNGHFSFTMVVDSYPSCDSIIKVAEGYGGDEMKGNVAISNIMELSRADYSSYLGRS